MSPQQLSKAHALEENGGPSTLMEHQLMSQSSSRLSWRRMFSLQGRTGAWIGRADSCSTGSPPPPSPPPPPSQPPSVSTVSPAPRLVAASAANLSTWSSFYLLQCLTDIHFVNSQISFHEPELDCFFLRQSGYFCSAASCGSTEIGIPASVTLIWL